MMKISFLPLKVLAVLALKGCTTVESFAFVSSLGGAGKQERVCCSLSPPNLNTIRIATDKPSSINHGTRGITSTSTSTSSTSLNLSTSEELNTAPSFNGQLILPIKVVLQGLKNHKVAAVYAVQPDRTKGYAAVKHISITKDLFADLESLLETHGSTQMGFVRALSFAYPQKAAMGEVAQRWASMVAEEDGQLGLESVPQARSEEEKEELVKLMMATADYDDDDDDDEFEYEDDDDDTPSSALFVDQTKVAPKATELSQEEDTITSPFEMPTYASTSEEKLIFNLETVDKVLDEIRPYLISDGGNVSVDSVNVETRSVYLILEGACGSCPSSTVTMQMGIERVLKENFENIGEVAQVEVAADGEGGDGGDPKELTMDAVMKEVNRISPAITAMGGNVEILSVDPLGVVEIRFRGANKVQQGLELALRDVKFVKHVKFVN